jgi:hypothetical protein
MGGLGLTIVHKSIIYLIFQLYQIITICALNTYFVSISQMLVSLQLSKEAKYLVAGNPLSFNNHLSQKTVKEIQGNDLGYGNIVKDWAIRRLTTYVH